MTPAILFTAFLVVLTVLAALGRTADSRDSADWKPTVDGVRAPR